MSTYSTNLKVELIDTNDQAGTWGNTTNTNLGTALEQSITGIGNASFPSDANLTLTFSDTNSSQVFRNLVLSVTSSGSLTATRDLIVPTVQKQYLVWNNTTGGQSIVVKTVAGTGIVVPNGAKMHLMVDGTNVVEAVTSVAGGEIVADSRSILSGDGLTGGGNLSADRTLSVDSTVVRTSRNIGSGDGLSGGGDLSANRTLAVDSTVVRTSRTLTAGNGLTGGGDLSSNRTFTLGTPGTISTSSSNSVSSSSHTHSLTLPSSATQLRLFVLWNGNDGSIRGSSGVSSVSKTSTGLYTVNFSSSQGTTNYTITSCVGRRGDDVLQRNGLPTTRDRANSSVKINTVIASNAAYSDFDDVDIALFR